MFNGLIREIALVRAYRNNILSLKAQHKPNLGDSIAVNGACLSVISIDSKGFELELSKESRTHLALENFKDRVHIEPALCYGARIDGHLMQGHIDGLGVLERIEKVENGRDFYIKLPANLMPFMAEKGSIGIDGLSLTINEVFEQSIRLTIIPITLKESLLGTYKLKRRINIESDLLARYTARILNFKQKEEKGLSWEQVEKISFLY